LSEFKSRIPKLKKTLDEAIHELNEFSKGILKREYRNRKSEVAQFIEDKKFLESLVKSNSIFIQEKISFRTACMMPYPTLWKKFIKLATLQCIKV
jgi:hypothetical protein